MREHLGIFRGFSPDKNGDSEVVVNSEKIKGKWIQGFYSIDTICSVYGTKLGSVIRKVPTGVFDDTWFEVLPETVGECTGLTDKNGKLIFEGDIVVAKMGYCGNEKLFITEHKFTIKYQHGIYPPFNNSDYYEFEVVGNLYEHPELLGDGSR